jgi:hypothetical protein
VRGGTARKRPSNGDVLSAPCKRDAARLVSLPGMKGKKSGIAGLFRAGLSVFYYSLTRAFLSSLNGFGQRVRSVLVSFCKRTCRATCRVLLRCEIFGSSQRFFESNAFVVGGYVFHLFYSSAVIVPNKAGLVRLPHI